MTRVAQPPLEVSSIATSNLQVGSPVASPSRMTANERRARSLAVAAPLVAAAIASVVLTGWILDVSVLKSGLPGLVEMKANTAVCFLLLAASARLLLVGPGRTTGLALATAAALVALASLGEYVFGRDLGIDQILFREDPAAVATSHPGRMAPNTAVAFVLIAAGLAAMTLRSSRRAWISAGLALASALLALVALVGYVSGITSLYAVSELTQMAVPAAIAFLALAVAIACAQPDAGPMRLVLSDTLGGTVMRLLFPVTLAVPLILGTLRLAGESAGLYETDTGTWLFALSIIALLIPLTWSLAAALDRGERTARRAQAARQEVQRERAAFEEAPIGSALVSPDGRFVRVNRALCRMIGRDAEELLGVRLSEITHPEDRAATAAPLAEMAAGRLAVHHVDSRYVHRNGDVLHVRVAAIAIYNQAGDVAHLHTQIQDLTDTKLAARRVEEAQFETLSRLAAAAEYRDDETGEHTRRVGQLAGRLAEGLGLPSEIVRLIRLAAPLHDVGKIGIPDAILLKPGPLTDEEFDHMKRHTTIGANMLSGGRHPQVVMAEQIAATHHERWDGTGYPYGLAGEDIPIAGRIVAVADVFDALTHARPYKPAWPVEEALAELRRQRGRQFDPRAIDVIVELGLEPTGAATLA